MEIFFSLFKNSIICVYCVAMTPFCLICRMLFKDRPPTPPVDGWEGCVRAEEVAVGTGRPLQGGAGTPLGTRAQVSYPLHKVHCRGITSARKEPLRLLTSLSPPFFLLPERPPFLTDA